MASHKVLISLAIAGLLQTSVVLAQTGLGAAGAQRPSPRFDAGPQLGERIADLTIVDDQGEPVNLRDLANRSPYTVLTLGCLT